MYIYVLYLCVLVFKDGFLAWNSWTPADTYFDWLPSVHNIETIPNTSTTFHWKMLSYNVGSLKDKARVPYLRQQLDHYGIILSGLQETRTNYDETFDSTHLRFIATADKGVGGCELWVSTTIPFHSQDQQDYYFERKQFQSVHTDPQILVVNCDLPTWKLTFAVAHAPHSGKGNRHVSDWWISLARILKQYSTGRYCILFIDANAQPTEDKPHVGENADTQTNVCGKAFNECLRSHNLFLPATYPDMHTGPHDTWQANTGHGQARIDFIALPLDWLHLGVQSHVNLNIDSGVAGLDHNAVQVSLTGIISQTSITKRKHPGLIATRLCRRRTHNGKNSSPNGQEFHGRLTLPRMPHWLKKNYTNDWNGISQ